jgi:hypothetical protein
VRLPSTVARARLTPPSTSPIRSRIAVRTVASAMASEPTTSVTTCRPSVWVVSRSRIGSAAATVAIPSASAISLSMSAW